MTLTHEQASIHNQQSIFQQVKEHLKHNPRCLNMLFPNSKQKGNEIYFDAPSYNSWSYNVNKAVVNDFRDSCHGEDIIDTYKKCSGMTNSYEAAREMARKLNITTDNKNRTMKKQDSGDVNHNNVILEQSKDTFQESQTNDSQIHSNTELENNQAKEERYISAKVELNKMIKSSSNSYEELRNHLYSQKKQLEPSLHNGQLSIGNYYHSKKKKTVSAVYVPAFKVGSDDIETAQFITEDTKDNKKWHFGIATKGVFYPMGIKAIETANCNEVILCEGLATGEKIYSSINKEKPVLSCFSKSNIYNVIDDIKRSSSGIKITIAADGDAYNEVKEKLSSAGYNNLYVTQPNLTDIEEAEFRKYQSDLSKQPDFWDLWKVAGEDRVEEELNNVEKIEYEEPSPIEFCLQQIEELNVDDLLDDNIIIKFIKEVSRSTETPIEFSLFSVFSAISTCVMGKVFVKIKDDYIEPIILSTIIIAKSGEGKTPVYNHVMKPILEKQKEYRKEYKDKYKEWQHCNKLIDEKIKKIKDKAKGKHEDASIKEIMEAEEARAEEPIDPTITAQDITPEQITNKLVRQGGRIAIIDHEGGIFNTIAGRYNNNGTANTDVFTKGYNGSELKVDRGDKSVDLDNTYVLLLIFLQPNIFKRIKNFEHFIDSGFFARTLFLTPKSKVGYKTHRELAVNKVIKGKYSDFIQDLMSYENSFYLQFSEAAQEMYIGFCTSIGEERRIGGEFEDDFLGGWVEKLKGNTARLAGILHIIDNAESKNIANTQISKETLGKAIRIAGVLIEHAMSISNSIGISDEIRNAMDLWSYIESRKLCTFTEAEIWQKRRRTKVFEEKKGITSALEVLAERFFIFKVENFRTNNIGNQPSSNYRVNKNIAEKWKK